MRWFKKKPIVVSSPQDEGRKINVNSGTWLAVLDWAEKERQLLMVSNNSIKHGISETAYIRGQIKTLDRLLRLDREKPGLLWGG